MDAVSIPDSRRLVLGAAIGFGVDDVRVFVESLRACGYRGDVLMLVRWPGLAVSRYLRRHGIESMPLVQIRSFSRSPHARRYTIYADYLRQHLQRYDQVMLSDTRDVVFQAHPFEGLANPRCHFFLESAVRTIGTDETNARWVRGCFGVQDVKALAPRRISCSGITIGGAHAMLAYLDRMTERIQAIPYRIYREIGHGYDQALHNYLVHLDERSAGVVHENNGHIATMALEPRARYVLGDDMRIRTSDGHLPAICHQYDRFPDLRAAMAAHYPAT
ncbi:MAG TPA: hypothetical protein VNR11_13670 [Xanthobacteraceae bacterium]|nr:hypothetical protein [Xanthobacteraceae bacterium]